MNLQKKKTFLAYEPPFPVCFLWLFLLNVGSSAASKKLLRLNALSVGMFS